MCFHKTLTLSKTASQMLIGYQMLCVKARIAENLQLFLNFTVEFCQTQHTEHLDLDDSQIEQ